MLVVAVLLASGCVTASSEGSGAAESATLGALQQGVSENTDALDALEERLSRLEGDVVTTDTLSGYATKGWVEAQGYGSADDLSLLTDLGAYLTVNTNTDDLFFKGANLHIRSGGGFSDDDGVMLGLGNLIIGYSLDSNDTRVGSHNLIIGDLHSYTWAGNLISGTDNTSDSRDGVMVGATTATSSGQVTAVLSGEGLGVSGQASAALGGAENLVSGGYGVAIGGSTNTASGEDATITGGLLNTASGVAARVAGGQHNLASELASSVLGGSYNQATATTSTVVTGNRNVAAAASSVVLGGQYNTTGGSAAAVVGGLQNAARGEASVIYAGQLSETDALLEYAPTN